MENSDRRRLSSAAVSAGTPRGLVKTTGAHDVGPRARQRRNSSVVGEIVECDVSVNSNPPFASDIEFRSMRSVPASESPCEQLPRQGVPTRRGKARRNSCAGAPSSPVDGRSVNSDSFSRAGTDSKQGAFVKIEHTVLGFEEGKFSSSQSSTKPVGPSSPRHRRSSKVTCFGELPPVMGTTKFSNTANSRPFPRQHRKTCSGPDVTCWISAADEEECLSRSPRGSRISSCTGPPERSVSGDPNRSKRGSTANVRKYTGQNMEKLPDDWKALPAVVFSSETATSRRRTTRHSSDVGASADGDVSIRDGRALKPLSLVDAENSSSSSQLATPSGRRARKGRAPIINTAKSVGDGACSIKLKHQAEPTKGSREFHRSPTLYFREKLHELYKSKNQQHVIKDCEASHRLNKLSGGGAFGSAVVRPAQIKRYYNVFRDMNVGPDGMMSCEDFKRYLTHSNPKLAQHSTKMFNKIKGKASGDRVNFLNVLRMLFPSATDADLAALKEMTKGMGLPNRKLMLSQLDEARELFKLWTHGGAGTVEDVLTPEQMEAGLEYMGQEGQEVSAQVRAVFGDGKDGAAVTEVDFTRFFAWYSGGVQLET